MTYSDWALFSYLVVGLYIFFALRKKCKLKTTLTTIVVICVGITVFCRLFWIVDNIDKFKSGQYGLAQVFMLRMSGFKIIGVLLGAIAGTCIVAKIFKDEKKYIIDASTESLFLGAAYTKILCTLCKECCFGDVIDPAWFGVYGRHLTALYEVFVWLIGFAMLHILKGKVKHDFTRISISVIWYILVRMFILEGLYEGAVFMGSWPFRIIYGSIVAFCTYGIIKRARADKKAQVETTKESEKVEVKAE